MDQLMQLGTEVNLGPGDVRWVAAPPNKSSAVAEYGDRGHNRHGRKEGGGLLCPFRGQLHGTTSNTMWPVSRCTSVPSGVFIHPAVWPKGELIGDANVAARLSGDI